MGQYTTDKVTSILTMVSKVLCIYYQGSVTMKMKILDM